MLASSSIIHSLVSTLSPFLSTRALRPHLVVDPVTISTSKHTLLPPSAVRALCTALLPLASVVTPNVMEAELLVRCLSAGAQGGRRQDGGEGADKDSAELGRRIEDAAEAQQGERGRITDLVGMIDAARTIRQSVPGNTLSVLVKGGHLQLDEAALKKSLAGLGEQGGSAIQVIWGEGVDTSRLSSGNDKQESAAAPVEVLESHRAYRRDQSRGTSSNSKEDPEGAKYVVDVLLVEPDRPVLFVSVALKSTSTHGTGCTLSAAIAARLALGDSGQSARVQPREGVSLTRRVPSGI